MLTDIITSRDNIKVKNLYGAIISNPLKLAGKPSLKKN